MRLQLSILFFLFFLFSADAGAKSLTFNQVHMMPKSLEKDYYIWRFLCQGNCTASQAQAIVKDVNRVNKKLRESYRRKTGRALVAPSAANGKTASRAERDAWLKKLASRKYFTAAIAALAKKNKDLAIVYFDKARRSSVKRSDLDKANFWLYKTTGNKAYLNLLLKSWDVNLYTLSARDMMHIKYPRTITPKLPKKDLRHYDEKNPIQWAIIKKKLFKPGNNLTSLAKSYQAEESIGVYTYIRSKASRHREIYYPMPYRDIMAQLPKKRQALIYAIARQESRFVPASVSPSFALGMMQIMPFLVKHIAKERGETIDLDEMFNPHKAIVYANHHLNYLSRYLYHPLFIAYAYNGGIGFTRKLLQRKEYFRKGPYEPYLSMEKIANDEAREYGKKVLVNYVIYLNKLGIHRRITPYIEALTDPSRTDTFR